MMYIHVRTYVSVTIRPRNVVNNYMRLHSWAGYAGDANQLSARPNYVFLV